MNPSIHGHEVMHFMLEKGGSFTRETLEKSIIEHFGADTRFHACSAEGMTAAELIDFLAAKGKFIESDAGFNTQADKICNH